MYADINLRHLKFFCDAVIYESITEAAKMNHISHSAVSQAISKLEIVFGAPLMRFHRQKLQLTEEGKVVFEEASQLLKHAQNIFDRVQQIKKQTSPTLEFHPNDAIKFVTTNSLGMSYVSYHYNAILKKYPQANITFQLGNLNFIRTALKRNEADFAIVVYNEEFDQFQKHVITKGAFNLYQEKKAPKNLIEKGVSVDHKQGMYVKDLQDFLGKKKLKQAANLQIVSGWNLIAQFCHSGISVGFFPDYVLLNNQFPQLKVYPLKLPPFEYEICAIYNKSSPLSPIVLRFLEQFKQE